MILWAPGVGEVFALEKDAGVAQATGEVGGVEEGGWAARVGVQQPLQGGLEAGVLAGGAVGLLQLREGGHEGFGDEASAVGAEAAPGVGEGLFSVRLRRHIFRAGSSIVITLPPGRLGYHPVGLATTRSAWRPAGRPGTTRSA